MRWLAVGLLFTVGAIVLTWPLAVQLQSGIPLGTETVATVPLFNLWTLAWNVESVSRSYEGYWQAPIFHPAPHTFALSEPQPLTGLAAAALSWVVGSVLGAYNLLLLLALITNALCAAILLRAAGLRWLPAVAGGGLVLVLPFTHQELGVIQLVPLAGVFLFALVAFRFAAEPSWRKGLLLGSALFLAYALSAQIAVFAVLAGGPALIFYLAPRLRERQAWEGLVVAAGLFLVLASPLILAQRQATSGEGYERSAETMRKHSAQPSHYLKSAWPMLVPTPGIETADRPSRRAFWPGTLRVLLALGALIAAWRHPTWRRLAVCGAFLLVTSQLFSWVAHMEVGSFPFLSLLRSVPGLSQIRSYFRFALFVQLAVVGLAALALELLLRWSEKRWKKEQSLAFVAAIALVAVVEVRPTMGEIQPLPSMEAELPWLSWITENTEQDDVLAFVPFPEGRSARDYLTTAQSMYWQMRHWRPMVNGYSGFFPDSFRDLKDAMQTFPSQKSLQALRDADVRYCIIPRAVIERSPAPDPNGAVQLLRAYQDEQNSIAIFELR